MRAAGAGGQGTARRYLRRDGDGVSTIQSERYHLYCGFDADATGDQMAHAMLAIYPAIQRLRPPLHDWNDVLTASA